MNTEPTDVRLGLTSASNAAQDLACPGRYLAQRGLANYESRDASLGSGLHKAFETGDTSGFGPMHRKTVERGRYLEATVWSAWARKVEMTASNFDKGFHPLPIREQRLWLTIREQKTHSGAIDALWFDGDERRHALIEDLKSLFGDVDDAESNLQLRDYAALVFHNFGCETVSVFINQPNVRWKEQDQKLITYQHEDLEQALAEMTQRVLASNDPDSPRIPGRKQCQFCLACGTSRCPESLQVVKDFTANWNQVWLYWSPAERGEFIEKLKLAESLADSALKEAKANIAKDPNWATGWGVSAPQQVRKIDDVQRAAQILVDAFGQDDPKKREAIFESIAKACKVSLGDLEEIHANLTTAETGAEKFAEFNLLFGDLITRTERAGSLKKVKEGK